MLESLHTPADCAELKLLILSPHPDDEVIGAGSRLPWLRNALVVQVSDGSPPDLRDALENGFTCREEYARARRAELRHALALAGSFRTLELGYPDQELSFHLGDLARNLAAIIAREQPDALLTVPYEGGHPDHDATAFAAALALSLLEEWRRPALLEMTSYHHRNGTCAFSQFLQESPGEIVLSLSAEECALKRRMFDCFRTQQKVLQWFPIGIERFRAAPYYDFTHPPHPGPLYYELFPWGMTGRRWRELAATALRELGPPHPAFA